MLDAINARMEYSSGKLHQMHSECIYLSPDWANTTRVFNAPLCYAGEMIFHQQFLTRYLEDRPTH